MFLQGFQAAMGLIWLPGVLYFYTYCGLRGKSQWIFFLESFVAGMALMVVTFALFGGLIPMLQVARTPDVAAGMILLTTKGFDALMEYQSGAATIDFILVLFTFSIVAGGMMRLRNSGLLSKTFSTRAEPALDIELFRLRERKTPVSMTIKLTDGTIVRGKCRTYTYTEPREIVLDMEEDGKKYLLWLKLDRNVESIRIDVPEEALARPKSPVLRLFKGTQ